MNMLLGNLFLSRNTPLANKEELENYFWKVHGYCYSIQGTLRFKGLYLSAMQHLPWTSGEVLLPLLTWRDAKCDLNQGRQSSSSLMPLVMMCKSICYETKRHCRGGREIHRRESSFSSSLLRGFIWERNMFIFLAHRSNNCQVHTSSLCLGICYFPPNHSLLPLPVLLIHSPLWCQSDLEKMKLWSKSLSSLQRPWGKVQLLTQKVCHHPSPSYCSSFVYITSPRECYFSPMELPVGAQTGQALKWASTSHPSKTCCPSDAVQTLPRKYPLTTHHDRHDPTERSSPPPQTHCVFHVHSSRAVFTLHCSYWLISYGFIWCQTVPHL